MKLFKMLTVMALTSLLSSGAWSADRAIHLRTGEMTLGELVESLSDELGVAISAASVDGLDRTRVTIASSPVSLTREGALAEALVAFNLQGFTLVEEERAGAYRLMRSRDARDDSIPMVTDPAQLADNDLMVSHQIPLKHFPPEAMARALRSFMPASSRLIPDDATQSLFITDSSRSMAKYRDMAARLDTPKGAEDAWAQLKRYAKVDPCAPPPSPAGPFGAGPSPMTLTLLIGVFGLLGAVIGFISRGYVIRRIEGGLVLAVCLAGALGAGHADAALSTARPALLAQSQAARALLATPDQASLDMALRTEAKFGRLGRIDDLIARGADVNSRAEYGETALDHAILFGRLKAALRLIELGADPNAQDDDDRSPLLRAAGDCNFRVVSALLKAGADVNHKDLFGRTPLIAAADNRCLRATAVLLTQARDRIQIDARDLSFRSAADYAQHPWVQEMIEIASHRRRRADASVEATTLLK